MERRSTYTEANCSATRLGCSILGKVVVISQDNPERQLYFCLCGNGAGANSSGSAVFLVSLRTGEFALKNRSEVIGILKPELLPDSAKLQLSQIRPVGALDFWIENIVCRNVQRKNNLALHLKAGLLMFVFQCHYVSTCYADLFSKLILCQIG